jgi:hypothetical protein
MRYPVSALFVGDDLLLPAVGMAIFAHTWSDTAWALMLTRTLTKERPSQETAKKVFGTLVVTLSFIYHVLPI